MEEQVSQASVELRITKLLPPELEAGSGACDGPAAPLLADVDFQNFGYRRLKKEGQPKIRDSFTELQNEPIRTGRRFQTATARKGRKPRSSTPVKI